MADIDNSQRDVRDAVIKLEAKMDTMTASMTTLADSVAKIADVRFELVNIQKELVYIQKSLEKKSTEIEALNKKFTALSSEVGKNTYVTHKVNLVIGALITGIVSLLVYKFR